MRALSLITVLLTCPCVAQELTPSTDRLLREGKASFECAVLAAEGSEATKENASSLAVRGHTKLLAGMSELLIVLKGSLEQSGGPLGAYLLDRDASFMVGLSFAEATQNVKRYLDVEAPFDGTGGSYEDVRALRDLVADQEYARRNCDLLGP